MFDRSETFSSMLELRDARQENEYLRERLAERRDNDSDSHAAAQAVGYKRGFEAGKNKALEDCLQIIEHKSTSPKKLAKKLNVSIDVVNKIFELIK